MQINSNIIDRNVNITKHLDHLIVMWREGRIEHEQAKIMYRFLIQRLILMGHHEMFLDDFEAHVDDQHEDNETKRLHRYTFEEIESLKRLYARGRTAVEIGNELGRSAPSVRTVIKRLQTQKVLPKRYKPRASASNININNNNEGK